MKKYSAFIWAYCGKTVKHRLNHEPRMPCNISTIRLLGGERLLALMAMSVLLIAFPLSAHSQTGYSNSRYPVQNRYAAQQPTYQYPATNPPQNTGTGGNSAFSNQPQSRFQSTNPYQVQTPIVEQPILFEPQAGVNPGQQDVLQPSVVPNIQSFPGDSIQPGILDLDVTIPQTQSQRIAIGATYGSDNSLVGQFMFDEKDFDIRAWPRRVQDTFGRQAWRGGGQHLRIEAVPGNELQRYLVSWSNPYFRNSDYSLAVSGYLFDRQYFDYDEQRVGGRVGVGRQLSDFLSINYGLRMESVTIDNSRVGTSPQLNADLGTNNLFLGSIGLVYDSRVYPYLTGVGSYLSLKFTQAFGDYTYSRGDIDYRRTQTIYQRPDGSGRHLIEYRTNLGFTGSDTPVFENYIAGGMTSLRGFEFRGVSPIDGGVRVGGEFQWLNTLEYNFPLTQGDMIHGVMFVDFGTVEENITLNSENFRVAPGLGLRVHLPYAGLGAPLAFDFAYPVSDATGDQRQSFGFLIGIVR